MYRIAHASLIALALALPCAAGAGETPSVPGTKVYFIDPQDGAEVSSPFAVRFGVSGMGVAPAGVEKAKTGHHHLIIDADAPTGEDLDFAIPADEHFKHFGGGQTETTLNLPAGRHTLQLLLGDHNHIPHNPPLMSKKITVTVK